MQLLPSGAVSEVEKVEKMATPMTGSFVHLHLGILLIYCICPVAHCSHFELSLVHYILLYIILAFDIYHY